MTQEDLKQKLLQIQKNNYVLHNDSLYHTLALDMLSHIGAVDPVLRDESIYNIFVRWIEEDRFSQEQLLHFLQISIDDQHLMYGIGSLGNDSVFTRTFSVLIIASILCKNNEKAFLSPDFMRQIKNRVLAYYASEKDLRGYVSHDGWAHSVAHGADAIDELARCSIFGEKDLQGMLKALQQKICQGNYVYIDGEIDRINVAVRTILKRKLIDEEDVTAWLKSFHTEPAKGRSIETYHKQINIQDFFRSLYFTLKHDCPNSMYLGSIENMISTL